MGKELILITGCSGRIGLSLSNRLKEKYKVIGLDVIKDENLAVELIEMDISSKNDIEKKLEGIKGRYGSRIASFVHLAAYYNFSKGRWEEYQKITIKGTKFLLEVLLAHFEVDQFIFSSTMLVHAPCEKGQQINEEWSLEPKWNYPKSKVETEKIIQNLLPGKIPYLILRIAGVYDDHCHSIPLAEQTKRIYEKQLEARLFSGDLSHGSSFVHMEDLVEACALAIDKRKELPKESILLIGEPKTLSYDDLQREISEKIYGRQWTTWRVPKFFAKWGAWCKQHLLFYKKTFIQPWMIDLADDHYELDISKARRILGWSPKRNLKDTIPLWIEELKKDPDRWYKENKLS